MLSSFSFQKKAMWGGVLVDGAGEDRAGMGIMHGWDLPLCWAGHLIYTYLSIA